MVSTVIDWLMSIRSLAMWGVKLPRRNSIVLFRFVHASYIYSTCFFESLVGRALPWDVLTNVNLSVYVTIKFDYKLV